MAVRLCCILGEFLGEECNDGTILMVTLDEKELLLRTGHTVGSFHGLSGTNWTAPLRFVCNLSYLLDLIWMLL